MRKIFSSFALAAAFAVSASAGVAQESGEARSRKDKAAPAAADTKSMNKAQKANGSDCSPQRAGVRCSRPKPKKPWFFGD